MKSYDQIYDELLILRCQEGDRDAFGELVSRWQERLWRYAYNILRENDIAWDMVQETWITIIRKVKGLKSPGAFPQWRLFECLMRNSEKLNVSPGCTFGEQCS